jgi:hypothetical protein
MENEKSKRSIAAKWHHLNNPNFAMKGKHHSEETKLKMSLAQKGRPNPNKGKTGKKLTDETKQKIRDKRKLQIITSETKQKISEALKKNPIPKEKKSQAALKGWEKRKTRYGETGVKNPEERAKNNKK